jgi:hypothetical protein
MGIVASIDTLPGNAFAERDPPSHLFSASNSPGQFARTRDKHNQGAEMPYAKTTRSLLGRRSARSFCLAVVFSTMTAAAQKNAPPGNEGTTFAAWDAFADQLRSLGDQLVAHLPERLRDDPQVRQEAGRVLLEAVAAETIQATPGQREEALRDRRSHVQQRPLW